MADQATFGTVAQAVFNLPFGFPGLFERIAKGAYAMSHLADLPRLPLVETTSRK